MNNLTPIKEENPNQNDNTETVSELQKIPQISTVTIIPKPHPHPALNTDSSGRRNSLYESDLDNSIIDGPESNIPPAVRNKIFAIFLLANLFLNYDTGVIPASLLEIIKEVPLTFSEQALLGSLVYLGLSFASLFVSILFNRYGPSRVMGVVLLLNSSCCFVFSLTKIKWLLYLTRVFMGMTESFVVIYGPVWVNNYSPNEHSTKWMGLLHSSSAIGVMTGYLTAGLTINYLSEYVTWRFSIQIQGFAQIPIALFFLFSDTTYINIKANNSEDIKESYNVQAQAPVQTLTPKKSSMKKSLNLGLGSSPIKEKRRASETGMLEFRRQQSTRIDAVEIDDLNRFCKETSEVVCNPLYVFVALALCSMYFIVTGIQFWMTSYLIDILGNDPVKVVLVFSIVSITGPLFGVLIGGIFADKYGGYKGKNTLKALKLCSAFGVVSFVFAFPIGFLYSMIYITVLLWAFLFFGAAIIPIGTGIMVSSVSKQCQATSSSISQLVFNLFGYFASPIITGMIMDRFDNKHEGYKWGIRLIFWWSIFAVIFMSCAWCYAYRKFTSGVKEEKPLVILDDMDKSMGDLVKLEIMRRMTYAKTGLY